jgi:spoIIIJ-associated protein
VTSGIRRFFWGNSLAQALTSAARHYGLPPEELEYRIYAKRHGFVKHPRKVVVEVDPAAPRRAPSSVPPATPAAPPRARASAESPARPRPERASRPRRNEAVEPVEVAEGWDEPDEESIVALAEAARAVAAFAGLELGVEVRAGEGRVEVELVGPAEGEVVRRGLPLLEQMELLIPRAGQGLSGRRVRCRVDCGGLHSRREEELRALAHREAEAVRASGEPRLTAPLSPADRRIVHLALAEAGDVATESLGGGVEKRVRISPRPTPT